MIISIVGSVCAGKTTLAEGLERELGLPVYPIGHFRNQLRDEVEAWLAFGELLRGYDRPAASWADCVIVVSTGLNLWYRDVTTDIVNMLTIKLVAPKEVLLARAEGRSEEDDGYFPYEITRPQFIEKAQPVIPSLEADLAIDTAAHSKEETLKLALEFIQGHLGLAEGTDDQ
ncbi:MAG: hypothetical protein ACE5NP_10185 [Anaerolineae bacterium]